MEQNREWGYLVAGEWCREGTPVEVRSPYDASSVATVWRPAPGKLEAAIQAAVQTFHSDSDSSTFRRAAILRKMADSVERRREAFVRMLALEAGKPIKAGRVEVDRCVFNLRNASEEAQRVRHEMIPLDLLPGVERRWALVRRFPIGPILAITPFNFPLNLVVHKVAPATAVGNTVVQKPASKTPVCSLMLAEVALESGLAPGALNVVPCSGSEAERLVTDDRFALLTFTGSAEVGWRLKRLAGKKRVTLELGGNAGVIIEPDSDLEAAAGKCATGGFSYAGQSCISVQRIFVQETVFERFVDQLVERVRSLKIGDPLDESTDVGPLVTVADAERVESWIMEAESGGAKVLTGGIRHGAILEPTVLTNTQPGMKVNCQEVFGPVVTVTPYSSFKQALGMVNDTSFGLQAGVFTPSQKLAFEAFEKLEVGGVVINDVPTFRADHMPYGGVKDSGIGREGARWAIEEMSERKTMVLNLS